MVSWSLCINFWYSNTLRRPVFSGGDCSFNTNCGLYSFLLVTDASGSYWNGGAYFGILIHISEYIF